MGLIETGLIATGLPAGAIDLGSATGLLAFLGVMLIVAALGIWQAMPHGDEPTGSGRVRLARPAEAS